MSKKIASTIEKLFNGDSIPNGELIEAAEHFEKLVDLLTGMGPVWRMPLQEALRTHNTLNSYVDARGLKRSAPKIETPRPGLERSFIVRMDGVYVDFRQRVTAAHVKPEGWGPWVAWDGPFISIESARAAHDAAI